jgi:hypothetical protein
MVSLNRTKASDQDARRQEEAELDSLLALIFEATEEDAIGERRRAHFLWVPAAIFGVKDLSARLVLAELLFRSAKENATSEGTCPPTIVSQAVIARRTGLSLHQVKRGLRVLKAQGRISSEKLKRKRRTVRRYQVHLARSDAGRGVKIPRPLHFLKTLPARLVLAQLLYWLRKDRKGRTNGKLTMRGNTYRCMARSYPELAEQTGLSEDQVRRAVRHLKTTRLLRTRVLSYKGAPTTHYVVEIGELKTYL